MDQLHAEHLRSAKMLAAADGPADAPAPQPVHAQMKRKHRSKSSRSKLEKKLAASEAEQQRLRQVAALATEKAPDVRAGAYGGKAPATEPCRFGFPAPARDDGDDS